MEGDSKIETKQLDFVCDFQKFLSLKRSDNVVRRNVLKDIENELLKCGPVISAESNYNLENVHRILLSILKDNSEKCRETAAKILNLIFDRITDVEIFLPNTISSLVLRLGKSDERETSEEVRLLEVQMLLTLIMRYDGSLLTHFNDIICILKECIIDAYPEIKRKSCECVQHFALKQREHFHMVSESLINPLLQIISHQHFKTRVASICALGSIIRYGNNKDFEKVVTHLAQRLFDYSSPVRMAVTQVIGEWLIALDDRYSFFHKLIPMILSALYDEIPEIRDKAKTYWCAAGEQYLQENETDYKDLMDFPKPDPVDYPDTDGRPTVGCRILVQRHLYNILPPLINDIKDFLEETRLKSVKVLYSLILHAEEKSTIKLPDIIEGLEMIAKDQEKEVVKWAIKCAELLGYFIESGLLCDTVLSLVHKNPSSCNLTILAAIIRGHKTLPLECFNAICKKLSDPNTCRLRKAEEQASLLLCITAVLRVQEKVGFEESYQLFCTLVSVSGLTENQAVIEKAKNLMGELASVQESSVATIYKQHVSMFLTELIADNELWTLYSPEMPIFYFLVQSEYLDEQILDMIIPVLINNLQPQKEAKLLSHFLSLVSHIFKTFCITESEKLPNKILDLILKGIFPNMVWSAGKAAAALRTIAVASLYEIIAKNCLNSSIIASIGAELLPLLSTLSDDNSETTRLLSSKVLECILPMLHGHVDEHKIHTICHEFLKGMDDESDEIRMMTVKMLKAYFKSFPKDYNWISYSSYLRNFYRTILIHMDDENIGLKDSVLDLLKEAADISPKILLEEVENSKCTMRAGDLCDELANHIKALKM